MQHRLLYDLFQAYYDARGNKRNTLSQLAFEVDYESNIFQLYDELQTSTYQIGPSTCFLICDTVPREIFAADFRDRVVHHLLYNYIYTICDKQFIHDSYSCRIGKGTHYGIKRVDHFIRSCTQNYTKDGYILKLDIKGFFMNIEKERLRHELRHLIAHKKDTIHCEKGFLWIRDLAKKIIDHNPLDNYIFQGSRELYTVLPKDKSLFSSASGIGLPIGNLTSQLFANVYLHRFDVWMKHEMGCRYYGRYVDDFVIVHPDKEFCKNLIPKIKYFLDSELGLTLHPKKIYLQHYTKGIKFLGAYIKPWRVYSNSRIIGNAATTFYRIKETLSAKQKPLAEKIALRYGRASINSYLGIMKHWKNYKKRKKLCEMVHEYYIPNDLYTKVRIPHGTSRSTSSI